MRITRLLVLFAVIAAIAAPAGMAFGFDDSVNPPNGTVGTPYSFKFVGREGCPPYKFVITSGGLPPGLSLSDEGVLSGTPTTPGAYGFWVDIEQLGCGCPPQQDSCHSQRPFEIDIAGKLIVATSSLPDAPINQPYSQQLSATGGSISSWSLASGALPDGLTLSTGGLISGTPAKPGSFTFTVRANGSPNSDQKTLSIFVAAPLALGGPTGAAPKSQPVPVNAKIATPFAWGVRATGGRAPYTYSSTPLPAGLVLNPDGTVTGTPTAASSGLVTFTVTDVLGTKATLDVRLTVKALLAFSARATPKVGKVDRPYSWRIPVSGASKLKVFLASGSFPPGLELDEDTGVLSGTPLQAGGYRIKIWVIGDAGTLISKRYTIRIRA